MIDRLTAWMRRLDSPSENPGDGDGGDGDDDMQFAACALLVETAAMDGEFDDEERAVIEDLLARRFALAPEECAALVAEAERAVAASPQIFRFTNAVKTHFDEAGRVALIDMLWDVAHADGAVCAYEENLLRRIAGLLYVSDRDRGAARARARARAAAGREDSR